MMANENFGSPTWVKQKYIVKRKSDLRITSAGQRLSDMMNSTMGWLVQKQGVTNIYISG